MLFLVSLIVLAGGSSIAQPHLDQGKSIAAPVAPSHHVIMQMVSADTLAHKSLLSQLRNLKEVWGDSVEIEVLVQGPGLDLMMIGKSTQKENIYKVKEKNVHFSICEFSLRQRGLTREEILPGMDFVKYGLVEIITKQEQGWSYLKAGF